MVAHILPGCPPHTNRKSLWVSPAGVTSHKRCSYLCPWRHRGSSVRPVWGRSCERGSRIWTGPNRRQLFAFHCATLRNVHFSVNRRMHNWGSSGNSIGGIYMENDSEIAIEKRVFWQKIQHTLFCLENPLLPIFLVIHYHMVYVYSQREVSLAGFPLLHVISFRGFF